MVLRDRRRVFDMYCPIVYFDLKSGTYIEIIKTSKYSELLSEPVELMVRGSVDAASY